MLGAPVGFDICLFVIQSLHPLIRFLDTKEKSNRSQYPPLIPIRNWDEFLNLVGIKVRKSSAKGSYKSLTVLIMPRSCAAFLQLSPQYAWNPLSHFLSGNLIGGSIKPSQNNCQIWPRLSKFFFILTGNKYMNTQTQARTHNVLPLGLFLDRQFKMLKHEMFICGESF